MKPLLTNNLIPFQVISILIILFFVQVYIAKIATKLNVSLYDNPLTEKKGDFVERVQLNGTLTNKSVAKIIVAERNERISGV